MRKSILAVLLLALMLGCSSGGSGTSVAPSSPWPRFRHDTAHTGAGVGRAGSPRSQPIRVPVDPVEPYSAVIASPVLGIDGGAYALSTGGTLLAVNGSGEVKWRTQTCELCPQDDNSIGRTLSSPTLFAPPNGTVVAYFGSERGRIYAFEDHRNQAVCTLCFDAARARADLVEVRFPAPVTLLLHVATGKVVQLFAPAVVRTAGSSTESGLVFSISTSGELLWTYPRTAVYPSPFITAAALGQGSTLLVGSADGWLHALAVLLGGENTWRTFIGPFSDAETPTPLAPITSGPSVFAYTTSGSVVALKVTDGTILWSRNLAPARLASSLALGIPGLAPSPETPTPTTTATPTPTTTPEISVTAPSPLAGTSTSTPTPTATPTVTPLTLVTDLFGFTRDGRLFVLDARDGREVPTGDVQQAIDGEVLSSPALSVDSYLVFGSTNGTLYAIHNTAGLSAWPPIPLAPGVPIRSSPALGSDGTIWVGADDGYLYRIGAP
ncbi:MAG: hypothetical protein KatS3mg077_2993 [Candidatus Binatia bacterium]|nr:MAG: hypothetical protein KatS3mg077_2993 [Candidatus Binatia bacterium]